MKYIIYNRYGSTLTGYGKLNGLNNFENDPNASKLFIKGQLIRERKHIGFAHIKWELPNGVRAGADLFFLSDKPGFVVGFPNLEKCRIISFEQW